jgi:hypothetical protein
MKRHRKKYALLFATTLMFSLIHAQEADSLGFRGFKNPKLPYRQNEIKANFVPLLMGQIPICGELRITYERLFTHNQSFTAGFSYNYPNLFLLITTALNDPQGKGWFGRFSTQGARFTLGYRYYPFKDVQAPEGLFFGPYFSYNFAKIGYKSTQGSYQILNYLNAEAIVGYQVEISDNFYFEFFGGLGYKHNFVVYYDSRSNKTSSEDFYLFPPLKNVKLALQVNFCYAF